MGPVNLRLIDASIMALKPVYLRLEILRVDLRTSLRAQIQGPDPGSRTEIQGPGLRSRVQI